MAHTITLTHLNEASHAGGPSALTSRTSLCPAGGHMASISPAKYTSRQGASYVYEDRFNERGEQIRTVLIDSRSSSANRLEDALAQAIFDDHSLLSKMPSIRVSYERGGDDSETYHEYELPHRLVDAHVRLGTVEGEPVTAHPVYRAARNSSLRDLGALLTLSPLSVLFGIWDSTRKARQLRIPSSVVGEIIGVVGSARETRRSGARVDPVGASIVIDPADAKALAETQAEDLNPKKLDGLRKAKSPVRGAEFVIGAIPPGTEALDGIAASEIIRTHVLSFSSLRRLGFGKGPEGDAAIRALLAALALNALARSDSELYLRANCHLVESAPSEVRLDRRQGETESFTALTVAEADVLLDAAYEQASRLAGIEWSGQVLDIDGNPAIVSGASDDAEG